MILDDDQMVLVNDNTDGEVVQIIVPENITCIGESSGEFLGKTYKYDEYVSDDDIRFFCFVDGGALKGIRFIFEGSASDIEILALDKNITDSVIVCPP